MSEYRDLQELKSAAPYISAYTLSCVCLYLVTYWTSFNINPFDYIGASDLLIKSGMLLCAATAFMTFVIFVEFIIPHYPETEESIASTLKYIKPQIILVIILSAIALYISKFIPYLYIGLSGGLLVLIRPISCTPLIMRTFSSQQIRTAAAAFLLSLPALSFIAAKFQADTIIKQDKEIVMIRNASGPCKIGCALIGKIGDYFSVRGSNEKIIMIKTDEMKVFEIYEIYEISKNTAHNDQH